MKRVDDLLKMALALAENYLHDEKESGAIDKRFHSDIASFGTTMVQSGPIPAVAMFSDINSDAGKRRVKIQNIILAMLRGDDNGKPLADGEILKMVDAKKPLLLEELLKIAHSKRDLDRWRHDIMQACIALKMAVRTFKLEEVNDERS